MAVLSWPLNQSSPLTVNATNSTTTVFSHSPPLSWLITLLLTNGFGAVANVLLLLAMLVHRPLRQMSSSPLIIHSLVIDLYMNAVIVPANTIPMYLGPNWPLPATFCRVKWMLVDSTFASAMYAAAVLAVHRFIATFLPREFSTVNSRSVVAGLTLLPWLATMLLNLFPIIEGMSVIN